MNLIMPEIFGTITPPKTKEAEPKTIITRDKWVQENIIKTKGLKSDLLKGIKDGKDKTELLLLALYIISLMTDEAVTYKIAERYLKCDSKQENEQ